MKKLNDLPPDVRNKFEYLYNYYEEPKITLDGDSVTYMPPFAECYNLTKSCPCIIDSKGGLLRRPFFLITSCEDKIKISWEVLERVLIIKNDSIYYPYHTRKAFYKNSQFDQVVGGVTTSDEPRSANIKIDTLNFAVEKIR